MEGTNNSTTSTNQCKGPGWRSSLEPAREGTRCANIPVDLKYIQVPQTDPIYDTSGRRVVPPQQPVNKSVAIGNRIWAHTCIGTCFLGRDPANPNPFRPRLGLHSSRSKLPRTRLGIFGGLGMVENSENELLRFLASRLLPASETFVRTGERKRPKPSRPSSSLNPKICSTNPRFTFLTPS